MNIRQWEGVSHMGQPYQSGWDASRCPIVELVADSCSALRGTHGDTKRAPWVVIGRLQGRHLVWWPLAGKALIIATLRSRLYPMLAIHTHSKRQIPYSCTP